MLATTLLRRITLASLAIATPLSAQRTLGTVGRDFGNAFGDIFAVLVSPVHGSAKDWGGAALAIGASAATLPFDDNIDAWIDGHQGTAAVRVLDPIREDKKYSLIDIGTSRRILPLSGGLYLIGFLADKPGLRDAGLGCAAMQQASGTVRKVLYATVARNRPATANGDQYDVSVPGGEWQYHSFFAGHFANAMACATFFNERFDLGVAEPVIYGVAIAVGASRMADRRHWTSDTVLGGVFGYALGKFEAARQIRRRERQAEKQVTPTVAAPGRDGVAISPVSFRLDGANYVGFRIGY